MMDIGKSESWMCWLPKVFLHIGEKQKSLYMVINIILSALLAQTELNDPCMIENLEFFVLRA